MKSVRLMFLTAVLVLFASVPSIAAPDNGAYGSEDISFSFSVVGIVSAPINHNDIALMPDDGSYCGLPRCEEDPPALASISLINAYVDPGPAIDADTERERQRA